MHNSQSGNSLQQRILHECIYPISLSILEIPQFIRGHLQIRSIIRVIRRASSPLVRKLVLEECFGIWFECVGERRVIGDGFLLQVSRYVMPVCCRRRKTYVIHD